MTIYRRFFLFIGHLRDTTKIKTFKLGYRSRVDTSSTKYLILNKPWYLYCVLGRTFNTTSCCPIHFASLKKINFDVLAPWFSHERFLILFLGARQGLLCISRLYVFPYEFPCVSIFNPITKFSQFITSNLTLFVICVFPISITMGFWFPRWFLSIFINYALSQHVIWPLFVEHFLIFDWPTNPISRRVCHHSCPQSPAKTIISISARKTLWNGPLNEQWVSALHPGIKRFESVIP